MQQQLTGQGKKIHKSLLTQPSISVSNANARLRHPNGNTSPTAVSQTSLLARVTSRPHSLQRGRDSCLLGSSVFEAMFCHQSAQLNKILNSAQAPAKNLCSPKPCPWHQCITAFIMQALTVPQVQAPTAPKMQALALSPLPLCVAA